MKAISIRRLKQILSEFKRANVLVVGDLILDQFVWGKVARISPEAPIPVVEVQSESLVPGGAANVVNNICSVGGRAAVAGIIGNDPSGRLLKKLLEDEGANTDFIVATSRAETTVKMRIIAHHQHVVRVDREKLNEQDEKSRTKIFEKIRKAISKFNAIILEDYGKGVLTQDFIDDIIHLANEKGTITAADPKKGHYLDFTGVTLVTPNYDEAFFIANVDSSRENNLEKVGDILVEKWGGAAVLITLGEKGMCLFQKGRKPQYIPTMPKDVYDVAGAGDTVIGVVTLALASGATVVEAAHLANYAAGIVIEKVGTGTVTREELLHAISEE